MPRTLFNSSSGGRPLYQQPYAQLGGNPSLTPTRHELDLREWLDEIFFGYRSGVRHGYNILIRHLRRDTIGKPISCTCKDAITREPDPDCSYCFTGDTLIKMDNGSYKTIDSIKVGDLVVTQSGEIHEVEKLFVRKTNHLLKIKSRLRCDPINTTPNHVFFTISKINFDKRKFIVEEKRADELLVNDYLLLPKSSNLISGNNEIEPNWKSYSRSEGPVAWKKLPIKLHLDNDLLWLFGLYCAEGHIGMGREIYFSLHINEIDYAKELERIFHLHFPELLVRHIEKPDSHVRQVVVANSCLARWFEDSFGKGCQNKRFPAFIMNLSADLKLAAVHGVWDGDGHTRHSSTPTIVNSIGVTARELMYQCQYILWENHIFAGLSTYHKNMKKPVYTLEWTDPDTRTMPTVRGFAEFDSYWASQITEITHNDVADTLVYDLRVKDNHSFIANHILVHNCFGEGFLSDESWYWTYSMYGGADSGLSNRITYMPPGNIRVDYKIFYLRYDVPIKYGDKIVEVKRDAEGNQTIPFVRESIYTPQTINKYRADNSRIEYIAVYCREGDALRLDNPNE